MYRDAGGHITDILAFTIRVGRAKGVVSCRIAPKSKPDGPLPPADSVVGSVKTIDRNPETLVGIIICNLLPTEPIHNEPESVNTWSG